MSSVAELLVKAGQFSEKIMVLGLDRVRRLLRALGDPHLSLPPVVHVAGTNGKGSTIAFLEAMLREAGLRIAVYTSPHLVDFNERIQINGHPIDDDALVGILSEVFRANEDKTATFFELTTAAALLYFARKQPDLVLLETGLGGRLDATNVVRPELAVVTTLSLDHMDFLGNTLSKIAAEKAGILKQGVSTVADPGSREAASVIRERAAAVNAPLVLRGDKEGYSFEFHPSENQKNWRFQDDAGFLMLPEPALLGAHQYNNAALAVAAARMLARLGAPVTTDHLSAGLKKARHPARMEYFAGPPMLLIDGAHNPQAARAAAASFREISKKPVHLIFSALQDKDAKQMTDALAPVTQQVWTTCVGGRRGVSADRLADLWHAAQRAVEPCATPSEAFKKARAHCPSDGCLATAGSLYLAGAVRELTGVKQDKMRLE